MSSMNSSKKSTILAPIVICMSLLVFAGCAFRNSHYLSFQEVRQETASNYSQQVLDAIVGIMDRAEMPLFFSVEAGQSGWSPTYTANIAAAIPGPWRSDTTTLNPTVQSSETFSSTIQLNDFGSAAMSRVSMLYGLLCFPIQISNTELPHGALFTTVEIHDTPNDFVIWSKLKNGKYLGVTEEKKREFLLFAQDTTYWTQHSRPETGDLLSTAGLFYRFTVDYPEKISELAEAVVIHDGLQSGLEAAQKACEQQTAEYEAAKKDALAKGADSTIAKTLLEFEREDLKTQEQSLAAMSGQLAATHNTIVTTVRDLELLIASLESVLTKVKENDPDAAAKVDPQATVKPLGEYIDRIVAGDEEVLKQVRGMIPSTGSVDAEDSIDDLYRERFESLPQQFDQVFQGTQ